MKETIEIKGNFEAALLGMLSDLIDGRKTHREILYNWDKTRGNDTYTETKRSQCFGIDTSILEEVFPKYEISEGSLLSCKRGRGLSVVNSVTIDENGITEVNTQKCWFYEGELCHDFECYGESSVEDIYRFFDLVGEDFNLFEED